MLCYYLFVDYILKMNLESNYYLKLRNKCSELKSIFTSIVNQESVLNWKSILKLIGTPKIRIESNWTMGFSKDSNEDGVRKEESSSCIYRLEVGEAEPGLLSRRWGGLARKWLASITVTSSQTARGQWQMKETQSGVKQQSMAGDRSLGGKRKWVRRGGWQSPDVSFKGQREDGNNERFVKMTEAWIQGGL